MYPDIINGQVTSFFYFLRKNLDVGNEDELISLRNEMLFFSPLLNCVHSLRGLNITGAL
jgi:hypothetical protein